MQVLSLLVHDDWGVAQRIMSVFTRKRISVDTILAGPCEKEGCARVILASQHPQFPKMLEHVRRVHDVIEAEFIANDAEGFALIRTAQGRRPMTGKAEEVDALVAKEDGASYVKVYGAM